MESQSSTFSVASHAFLPQLLNEGVYCHQHCITSAFDTRKKQQGQNILSSPNAIYDIHYFFFYFEPSLVNN